MNEWAIVVGVALVLATTVALVVLAVYFWRKKTQTEQRYALLVQETSAPVEMQDMMDEEGSPTVMVGSINNNNVNGNDDDDDCL